MAIQLETVESATTRVSIPRLMGKLRLTNAEPPIQPTPIIFQPVAADGVTLQGDAVTILDNNGAADEGTIEGPSLVQAGGNYVLFFSSGCFITDSYTVNYATSDSIAGPYTRAAQPLFVSGDYGLYGPGGMSIYKDGQHMVFHARYDSGRALYNAVIATCRRKRVIVRLR